MNLAVWCSACLAHPGWCRRRAPPSQPRYSVEVGADRADEQRPQAQAAQPKAMLAATPAAPDVQAVHQERQGDLVQLVGHQLLDETGRGRSSGGRSRSTRFTANTHGIPSHWAYEQAGSGYRAGSARRRYPRHGQAGSTGRPNAQAAQQTGHVPGVATDDRRTLPGGQASRRTRLPRRPCPTSRAGDRRARDARR